LIPESEMAGQHQKISVALCTYNGGPYVAAQLESISAQTRPPDELVVCDDGSRDRTIEIVEAFASKAAFPVHLFLNGETLGPDKNFEKAITMSRGDIIALSDQDDVWHADKLRRTEEILVRFPRVGIVFTDAEIVSENLIPFGYTLWEFMGFKHSHRLEEDKAIAALLKRNPAFGQTMAFRSAFKDFVLPIPPDVGHDMWIGLLIGIVSDVGLVPQPLVSHRQHSNQVSVERPLKATFREMLSKPWAESRTVIMANVLLYEHACLRVSGMAQNKRGEEAIRLLQEKISHLRTRSNLPRKKLQRLPIALREFAALRYHRYSNGSLSLAKDLFL
jgi:glycosyl transferase family 2